MKRTLLWVWILVLAMVFMPGCKKKAPAAGEAEAQDLVRMLPETPAMILSFDMHRFTALPLFDKLIAEGDKSEKAPDEPFANYQDFVTKTGIDPKKDMYLVTVGFYGNLQVTEEMEILGVANLRYNKEKILKLLKENNVEMSEEAYEGSVIYGVKDKEMQEGPKEKEFRFAFLDAGNVLFGTPGRMKAGIDLFKGKGKDALSSGKTKEYLKKINTDSIFWVMMGNIPESVKQQANAGGMLQMDMGKVESFIGFADFSAGVLKGELQLVSSSEEANNKIADALNGIKGMAAMGVSQEEPETAQLLNSVRVTSSAQAVKLSFSIPEDLLNKLAEKAKGKATPEVNPIEEPQEIPQEDK